MDWNLDIEDCKSLRELLAFRNYCKFECLDSEKKIRNLQSRLDHFAQKIADIDRILSQCVQPGSTLDAEKLQKACLFNENGSFFDFLVKQGFSDTEMTEQPQMSMIVAPSPEPTTESANSSGQIKESR